MKKRKERSVDGEEIKLRYLRLTGPRVGISLRRRLSE
jgi:hypothetical protein